ncbi:hypothetical protein [uncultured Chitinophaga sp.]|uniref:hypothetical protein n=1 Tax=uncultured Chitinophaga sp. TaxID=339340 RepID=UPI0025E01C63|nr:hypothetical protein [uncultured Chitinophaga sp.]
MKKIPFLRFALTYAAGITAVFATARNTEAEDGAIESAVGRLTVSTGTFGGDVTCVNEWQGVMCTFTATAFNSFPGAGSATTGMGSPNHGPTSDTFNIPGYTYGGTTIH